MGQSLVNKEQVTENLFIMNDTHLLTFRFDCFQNTHEIGRKYG